MTITRAAAVPRGSAAPRPRPPCSPLPALAQGAAPRVVVVGGGFAGATARARSASADPRIAVTLVEPNPTFTACPFSNGVIAGLRDIARAAVHLRRRSRAAGVTHRAASRDRGRCRRRDASRSRDGTRLAYDRLVLAPGIDIALGRAARLRRGGRRDDAARLEGRRADAAAAPPARGDGRTAAWS